MLALFTLNSWTLTERCFMKRDQLNKPVNDQPARQVEYEVADGDLSVTCAQEERYLALHRIRGRLFCERVFGA